MNSQPTSTRSGLTLVLPPLTSGKLKKSHSKPKADLNHHDLVPVDIVKVPRPIKLKPLKEVLIRLIAQIKKKDDYAFFLRPVDLSAVPGYSDVIKRPMDFGTMTIKVNHGRYRSLEEFTADLRLVTSNAKTFNPPGTIYHSEADRIEAWGLDQITKASSTVIEYETDWNIEIEQEDNGGSGGGGNHDPNDTNPRPHTPMDIDGDEASLKGRSPSVQVQGERRRGTRGPYARRSQPNTAATTATTATTEVISPDGRLPGSKDGVGAFPPGSDWAEMMVQLKIKGKRYKTKKERMRIEKGGPPYAADGSLDYSEMEDPFTILSALIPEPSRTYIHLTPLYPSTTVAATSSSTTMHSQNDYEREPAPAPINISLKRPINHLISSSPLPSSANHPNDPKQPHQPKRRKHWAIARNVSARYTKTKDDDPQTPLEKTHNPNNPHQDNNTRDPLPTDWGSFAWLDGDNIDCGDGGGSGNGSYCYQYYYGSEDGIRASLRASLELGLEQVGVDKVSKDNEQKYEKNKRKEETDSSESGSDEGAEEDEKLKRESGGRSVGADDEYWGLERGKEGERYIRDVVYGGVDGLAYVRSLAEFVSGTPLEKGDFMLGMPLAEYVRQREINPLTNGLHEVVYQASLHLSRHSPSNQYQNLYQPPHSPQSPSLLQTQIHDQIQRCLTTYPHLSQLLRISKEQIDMASLIKRPEEIYESEGSWVGREYVPPPPVKGSGEKEVGVVGGVDERANNIAVTDHPSAGGKGPAFDNPEVLAYVLDYAARTIMDLDQKIRDGGMVKTEGKDEEVSAVEEDPQIRKLRLNLLALAKRAPLDKIARLPKELVPVHIRHFVPTIES